ncbi:MAG: HD domain-containing protein [Candidatus Hadarchaeales archaeon]
MTANVFRKAEWPYPVYKSFIVPYWENGTLSVRELSEKDVEEWGKTLKLAKDFITRAVNALEVRGEARLELVADLLVLFLKVPLLREPISLLPSPLKAYLAWRLVSETRLKEFRDNPIEFASHLYMIYREFRPQLEELLKIVEGARERVERCWFHLPADTRPVANCAGLIPHLLTTSALSWALAVQRGLGRREAALVRLSALLHDVGKPFAPKEHVARSAEIAEWFTDFLDPEEREEIVRLVRDHHRGEKEGGRIIREADRLSSATDRISGYLQEIVSGRLGRKPEVQELEGWDFWVELERSSPGSIRSLSEEFVEKVRRDTGEGGNLFVRTLPLPPGYYYAPVEGIWFGCVDLGGIQRFIRTPTELKAVAAASYVIETAVLVHVPAFIQQELQRRAWFPMEAFLYSGGGNLYFVFPEVLKGEIEGAVKKYTGVLAREKIPLELRMVTAQFLAFFPDLLESMAREMGLQKISSREEARVERGDAKKCKCCFTRIAEVEDYCKVCNDLIKLGDEFHFKERWETKIFLPGEGLGSPKEIFKSEWKDASVKLMEIIAGHDLEEIRRGVEQRNYAVLKVDGVCMGAFMASAISITDACERSARIDISLKRAFEDSARELYTALSGKDGQEARKAIARLELGLLYMGGDDSLALMSSWYAPIFTHSLVSRFRTYMGEVRGLSAGLAAGGAKAPVWSLIDAADELEREAKSRTREKVSRGAICYDVCEVPLSSTAVRYRRKELEGKKMTLQPFVVENGGRLGEILQKLSGGGSHGDWYRWALDTSREDREDNKVKKLAKRVRRCIKEAVEAAKRILGGGADEELLNEVSKLYMRRQQIRLKNREEWRMAVDACAEGWGKAAFGDVELLIKFALGGIA